MKALPLDVFSPSVGLSDVPDGSSSVSKAMALLTAFGGTTGSATLTELARTAGIPKSTAHRLLGTLRDAGVVDRDGMDWYMTASILRLGAVALRGGAGVLREVALPYLTDLYELTHENVHLGVLDGSEIVYLDKVYGHRSTFTPSRVGSRLSAHTSGLGKAILSRSERSAVRLVLDGGLRAATARSIVLPGMFIRQLEIARQAGVAFDHEECREGLVCVAAPIVGPSGRAVAAISVAGATQTLKVEQIADAVHHAAAQISRKAGPDVELIASGS